jgi:hypothetical protein
MATKRKRMHDNKNNDKLILDSNSDVHISKDEISPHVSDSRNCDCTNFKDPKCMA